MHTDSRQFARAERVLQLLTAAVAITATLRSAEAQSRTALTQGLQATAGTHLFTPPDTQPNVRRDNGVWVKPTPGVFMGALTKPIEKYTGPELMSQLSKATWFGWERNRRCHSTLNCGSVHRGRMYAQAIGDANVFPVNGTPAAGEFGVVIGRISNIGSHTDATTGLPGNQKNPDVYYYIVERSDQTAPTIKLARITYEKDPTVADAEIELDTALAGIIPCKDTNVHVPRPRPLGDFSTCAMGSPPETVRESAKVSRLMDAADATPWFSCAEGCCTVQGPPYDGTSAPAMYRHRREGLRTRSHR